MIEEALFQILSGHAGLQALVGTRTYPVQLPQDAVLPAVAYQRIDTPREYSHDGPSGLAAPTFQFSIWDPNVLTAKQVAAEVRAALHGARLSTAAGVRIGAVMFTDERDAFDQDGDVVGVELDCYIEHSD